MVGAAGFAGSTLGTPGGGEGGEVRMEGGTGFTGSTVGTPAGIGVGWVLGTLDGRWYRKSGRGTCSIFVQTADKIKAGPVGAAERQ
jgi:hypothetical protein